MIAGERAENAWNVFKNSDAYQLLLNQYNERLCNECKRLESVENSELLVIQTRVRELRKNIQLLKGKTPKWKEPHV
tara:strand:+ start:341 stop:568 length:228 start_codon:yes stop_codon:yes gene_type:complete